MKESDGIELLLKKHFQHQDYLDDNGFTALVMSQLPHKTPINPWVKRLILGLPVSLVTLLVVSFVPWLDVIHQVYAYYLSATPQKLILIGAPLAMSVIALPTYFLLSDSKN